MHASNENHAKDETYHPRITSYGVWSSRRYSSCSWYLARIFCSVRNSVHHCFVARRCLWTKENLSPLVRLLWMSSQESRELWAVLNFDARFHVRRKKKSCRVSTEFHARVRARGACISPDLNRAAPLATRKIWYQGRWWGVNYHHRNISIGNRMGPSKIKD